MNFVGSLERWFSSGKSVEREGHRSTAIQEELVALYDAMRRPLFRYLHSMGLADSDCEEAIQETFLALFRHLLSNKPRQNLQAWLFTVARNQALQHRKRRSEEVGFAPDWDPFDRSANPEEVLLRLQQHARVNAVITALADQDRECLALRSEGLPYREIARMQGRSVGAVALAVKRALNKLAEVSRT